MSLQALTNSALTSSAFTRPLAMPARAVLAAPIRLLAAASTSPPTVGLTPDPQGLPGAKVLTGLTNGIGGWALIAAMVGIVIGAVMWAFGHYSQNWQQAYNGRKGVIVSALAAVLIGGAPQIINWFVGKGGGI